MIVGRAEFSAKLTAASDEHEANFSFNAVSEAGNESEVIDVQPLNAFSSMVVRAFRFSILIALSAVQFWKVPAAIVVRALFSAKFTSPSEVHEANFSPNVASEPGNLNVLTAVQPLKAVSSIVLSFVAPDKSTSAPRLVQPEKALALMVFNPFRLPKLILASLVQFWKVPDAMVVRALFSAKLTVTSSVHEANFSSNAASEPGNLNEVIAVQPLKAFCSIVLKLVMPDISISGPRPVQPPNAYWHIVPTFFRLPKPLTVVSAVQPLNVLAGIDSRALFSPANETVASLLHEPNVALRVFSVVGNEIDVIGTYLPLAAEKASDSIVATFDVLKSTSQLRLVQL